MSHSLLSIDNVVGGKKRSVEVDRGVGRLVVEGDLGQDGAWPHQKIVSWPEAARSPSLGINGEILQIIHNGLILLINNGLLVLWLLGQNLGDGVVATDTKHLNLHFSTNIFFLLISAHVFLWRTW